MAQWWGYKPEEFSELDGDIQSKRIAAYRAKLQSESVISYEQAKQMKRKRPRSGNK